MSNNNDNNNNNNNDTKNDNKRLLRVEDEQDRVALVITTTTNNNNNNARSMAPCVARDSEIRRLKLWKPTVLVCAGARINRRLGLINPPPYFVSPPNDLFHYSFTISTYLCY